MKKVTYSVINHFFTLSDMSMSMYSIPTDLSVLGSFVAKLHKVLGKGTFFQAYIK